MEFKSAPFSFRYFRKSSYYLTIALIFCIFFNPDSFLNLKVNYLLVKKKIISNN